MTWRELVDAAVVGAARAPLPPLPPSLVDIAPADGTAAGDDAGVRLLVAAATLSRARRAGFRPPLDASETPEAAALDGELPPAPLSAQARLRSLLTDGNQLLVREWLTIAAGKVRPPDDALPALLESARQAAHDELLDALGPRGRWLARLNPIWAPYATRREDVDPEHLLELWSVSDHLTRELLLRQVRANDRGLARALVESTWTQDKPDVRDGWLSILLTDIGSDDEDIFENAIGDRSAEVRRTAVKGLGQLPQSRWQHQRNAEAATVLVVSKGLLKRTVTIVPLADMPPALARAGLPAAPAGTGQQAWVLQWLVGFAHPSVWRDVHGLDPAALLRSVEKSEWNKPFLAGLGIAARKFSDTPTLLALMETEEGRHLRPVTMQALPNDVRAEMAATHFLDPGGLMDVLQVSVPWPEKLTLRVVGALPTLLANPENAHLIGQVLTRLVMQLPPESALPNLDAVVHEKLRPSWRAFLDTLHTRAAIRRELSDPKEPSP